MTPRKGVTIIEILIVSGIFVIIAGSSVMSFYLASTRVNIASNQATLIDAFTTAGRLARNGVSDSSWGVYIPYDESTRRTTELTVFAGETYATRDSSLDIRYPVSSYIEFTTVDFSGAEADETDAHELTFDVHSGHTDEYGSMTLTIQDETIIIDVSENGFTTYE